MTDAEPKKQVSLKLPFLNFLVSQQESNKEMLLEFRETAEKLKKVTAILKAQEWFGKVGKLSGPYIPHSFILDTRYNTI